MPIPDFIVELRSKIGHDPLWLPGVTGLVLDDEGRILLGLRSDSRKWALPSGIPEPGEEMAESIAREVLEETGVVVEVDSLISIRTTNPIAYPNGDVTSYVDHFFACRATGGEAVVGDDESLAVGWFAADALPAPLARRTDVLLAEAAEHARTGRTHFAR